MVAKSGDVSLSRIRRSGSLIGQRPQEYTVDDAEDGGVGADPERQGDHRDCREARVPGQHPQAVTKVLDQYPHAVSFPALNPYAQRLQRNTGGARTMFLGFQVAVYDGRLGNQSIMSRIEAAVSLQVQGDRDASRSRLEELWDEPALREDSLCRCILAHYLADLQEDPREELKCDMLALAAADALTDREVTSRYPGFSLNEFYPSLHLNLAEDYRRLGDMPSARRAPSSRAQKSVDVLPSGGYGAMIRGGIAPLNELLNPESPAELLE